MAFKIGRIEGRAKPWFFRIPPPLSVNGKYYTVYFETETEAALARERFLEGLTVPEVIDEQEELRERLAQAHRELAQAHKELSEFYSGRES
jgi:uncharacterized membrane protein